MDWTTISGLPGQSEPLKDGGSGKGHKERCESMPKGHQDSKAKSSNGMEPRDLEGFRRGTAIT